MFYYFFLFYFFYIYDKNFKKIKFKTMFKTILNSQGLVKDLYNLFQKVSSYQQQV